MRKSRALVIGINEYSNLKSLSFCINDAKEFSAALDAKIAPSSCDLLTSGSVAGTETRDRINISLIEIANSKLGSDDVAFFFFAGHGFSTEGRDYLACSDTDTSRLDTALCTDDIVAALIQSGAGTSIIIIDACRENISRGIGAFGERTAEMARQKGTIVFFSCSPGEVSRELGALGTGHGVFTYALIDALQNNISTPVEIDQHVGNKVRQICAEHKLGKQQPYTTVAPVQKAMLNLFDGSTRTFGSRGNMILIVGPSNAGKTTLGRFLATNFGYTHIEMSSFAWQRFNAEPDYKGSLQDYLEEVLWPSEKEGIIASDMLHSNEGLRNVVVCGPRRAEEVETIVASGWNIIPLFLYSHAALRFNRSREASAPARYSLNYRDFIKKDLKEYAWGLAKIAQMPRFELLVNEASFEEIQKKVKTQIERFGIKL